MPSYGTLQVFDTMGARRYAATDYLNIYDEAELTAEVQRYLTIHNTYMDELGSDLIEKTTTERLMTWAANAGTIDMIEGDEYSRPDAQKILNLPVSVGLPLRLKQVAWQVTRDFMLTKTIGDLERIIIAATDADIRDLLKTIRQTLFRPTNNTTYVDRRVDGAQLTLRALLNADSAYIPPDQFGNTFNPATHTHYTGTASFTAGDLQALIDNVIEHYTTATMRVYINRAQEAAIRALTGFYPYYDSRLTIANNVTYAGNVDLNMTNYYNRPIGIFGAAEIFVKPWIPASYILAFNTAAPKPLQKRIRNDMMGSLHIAAEMDMFPLRASVMEREYGIGVVERASAAVLYIGNASYVEPAAWSI